MKKVNWQYLTDTLLFISVVGVVTIGFLLAFVIPKGPSAADDAKYFLGLHRHEWGDIHFYLGIAFTTLVVFHLALGWDWIRLRTRRLFGDKWNATLLAVCSLPFLVLAVCWITFTCEPGVYDQKETGVVRADRGVLKPGQLPPYNPSNAIQRASADTEGAGAKRRNEHQAAHSASREEPGPIHDRGSEHRSGILVTGQMTLRDIERQAGISATVLVARLGLPRSVSPDARLGGAAKKISFHHARG